MAQSVDDYFRILLDLYLSTAQAVGTDLRSAPPEVKALGISACATQAVVVRALVENGTVTDAELGAALNEARAAAPSWLALATAKHNPRPPTWEPGDGG